MVRCGGDDDVDDDDTGTFFSVCEKENKKDIRQKMVFVFRFSFGLV